MRMRKNHPTSKHLNFNDFPLITQKKQLALFLVCIVSCYFLSSEIKKLKNRKFRKKEMVCLAYLPFNLKYFLEINKYLLHRESFIA